MAAKLPDELEDRDKIKYQKVGAYGYTLPWAMSVGMNGECYVNGEYPFHQRPHGTVSMRLRIERDGVTIFNPIDMKFEKSFVTGDIPVVRFE